MKNRFFKLPIRFDVPRLVQDLNTCIQQDWSNHFNEKDYSGEWTGISLRSASGNTSDIHSTPNTEGYADTSLLIQCPYFQEIIKQIVQMTKTSNPWTTILISKEFLDSLHLKQE